MNCTNCSTPLIPGARYCSECGTAVAAPGGPISTRPAFGNGVSTCASCGADLFPGDIFCGVCGHVSAAATGAFTGPLVPVGPDEVPDDALPEVRPPDSPRLLVDPDADGVVNGMVDDLDVARIVTGLGHGERFFLQFSTGESVPVVGTGLIGRSPLPEPGEHFDHLVRIFDATRSVSKTHLEFGQSTGQFWVRDRYSGNGSLLRGPDGSSRRLDPGKRYPVSRGARVDIGEQFFVVT